MSLSALGRGNALRRARNAALAALLAAALVVNYSLFLVLLPLIVIFGAVKVFDLDTCWRGFC